MTAELCSCGMELRVVKAGPVVRCNHCDLPCRAPFCDHCQRLSRAVKQP